MSGILGLWPDDQVVELEAGVPLDQLRRALRVVGQDLPYAPVRGVCDEGATLGDLVLAGIPHPWQGRFGGWSDWILGARMRLPDGAVGMSGSRVVKSVAGFDVHRMLVGSGGALGVYETLIFRTTPLPLVPPWEIPAHRAGTIQRVLPSLLQRHEGVFLVDEPGAHLWWTEGVEPVRSEDDLLWVPGLAPAPRTADEAWFFERARTAFGPGQPRAD